MEMCWFTAPTGREQTPLPRTGIAGGAETQPCQKAEPGNTCERNLPRTLSLSLVICFLTCNPTDCRASGNWEHGSLEVRCSVILLEGKFSEHP